MLSWLYQLEGLVMNRAERRASKSKKGGRYMGLARPTDNGNLNGSRKNGKVGK